MGKLIGSSNKKNTLLTAGTQHTIDNQHKSTLLIQDTPHVCEIEECNEGELKIENCLSEFKTEEQKAAVLRNLGIQSTFQWGKISGFIEDQTDLHKLLKDKISREYEGDKVSKQIGYSLNSNEFILNEDFNKAINDLQKGDLNRLTLNDAIDILFHTLFPIEYKQWSITSTGNIEKSISFEKGTTKIVDLSEAIGTITFTATPGNLQDKATLTINEEVVKESNMQFSYSINIKLGDILNTNSFTGNTTVPPKSYNYELTTDSDFTNVGTVTATVKFSTYQHYFYFSNSEDLMNQKDFGSLSNGSTNTSGKYDLGANKHYIYALSPKKITKVETAAATSMSSLEKETFRETDGWDQTAVTYTPRGGTSQPYWLVRLKSKQSNCIKIRIS